MCTLTQKVGGGGGGAGSSARLGGLVVEKVCVLGAKSQAHSRVFSCYGAEKADVSKSL